MMRIQRLVVGCVAQCVLAAVVLLLGSNAWAASLSFTGSFNQDDDMFVVPVTLTSAAALTLRTWGYAGGTNAAGMTIVPGGFDPIVSLFNAVNGALLGLSDDGIGVPADPGGTGEAADSLLTLSLAAGSYVAVLTQYDNFPVGLLLSDGFSEEGQGNFTATFGCNTTSFCDSDGNARTSHWALDVVTASSVAEPATLALVAIGLMGFGAALKRRERAGIPAPE